MGDPAANNCLSSPGFFPIIDLLQFGSDLVIVSRFMGENAIRAVLDFFRFTRILKVSTALVPQRIERTITKQAIELFGIALLMAWKKRALDISKIFMAVVHNSADKG